MKVLGGVKKKMYKNLIWANYSNDKTSIIANGEKKSVRTSLLSWKDYMGKASPKPSAFISLSAI